MYEYKIITGSDKDNQMKLNQWRHKYMVSVIAMCPRGDGTTILLVRGERNPSKRKLTEENPNVN